MANPNEIQYGYDDDEEDYGDTFVGTVQAEGAEQPTIPTATAQTIATTTTTNTTTDLQIDGLNSIGGGGGDTTGFIAGQQEEEEEDTTTATDEDAELNELQKQIALMEEDHQLLEMQNASAQEEANRKGTNIAAPAGGGAGGVSSTANGAAKITSVFVGNLDPRTTEQDLRAFFLGCGTITRVTILKDKYTGQPKGSGYVEFENEDGCNKAVLKENQQCHGRPLKVALKRENVPGFMRGGADQQRGGRGQRGGGGPPQRGGRGGMGGPPTGGMPGGAGNPMMAMMAQAMAMMQGQNFSPYNAGGRGGRGRGGRGASRGRGQQ